MVGETYDLTVDASVDSSFYRTVNQTIVLARAGSVLVFGAHLEKFVAPPVPQFASATEITIADEGAICEAPALGCGVRLHAARVTIGGSSAVISPGQSKIVGAFFVAAFFLEMVDTGFCDSKSGTRVAGFRTDGGGGAAGGPEAAGCLPQTSDPQGYCAGAPLYSCPEIRLTQPPQGCICQDPFPTLDYVFCCCT